MHILKYICVEASFNDALGVWFYTWIIFYLKKNPNTYHTHHNHGLCCCCFLRIEISVLVTQSQPDNICTFVHYLFAAFNALISPFLLLEYAAAMKEREKQKQNTFQLRYFIHNVKKQHPSKQEVEKNQHLIKRRC